MPKRQEIPPMVSPAASPQGTNAALTSHDTSRRCRWCPKLTCCSAAAQDSHGFVSVLTEDPSLGEPAHCPIQPVNKQGTQSSQGQAQGQGKKPHVSNICTSLMSHNNSQSYGTLLPSRNDHSDVCPRAGAASASGWTLPQASKCTAAF